uniref:Uncharacterized protein n=1 Tax=Arundo donax TaxID=35708 RepID=A0A0A8YJ07_ARUDO
MGSNDMVIGCVLLARSPKSRARERGGR